MKRVLVSLRREVTTTSCEHWNGRKWVKAACSKVIWLKAKGTAAWTFALPRQTAAGTYVFQSAARDLAGNNQTRFVAGANLRRFTFSPASRLHSISPSLR